MSLKRKYEDGSLERDEQKQLISNDTRYTIMPIINHDTWDFVKKSYSMYWVAEEIMRDLSHDLDDIKTLNEGERRLLFKTLSFFASGDYIVNQNLDSSFYEDIFDGEYANLEAVHFYDFQRMIENVHSQTYSLLLEAYVKDDNEKKLLIEGIKNDPFIKKKAEWCLEHFGKKNPYNDLPADIQQILKNISITSGMKSSSEMKSTNSISDIIRLVEWTNEALQKPKKSFAERLIAQACTELIGFSGSFCIIFWFAQRNRFKGLKKANELISRDEGLHGTFACHMYKKIGSPLPEYVVKQIIDDYVDIEIEYIGNILPENLLGMNKELMSIYIKFMANYLSGHLGYKPIYEGITNPFPFMDMISISVRSSDFFKTEPTEYRKANADNTLDEMELKFD